MARTVPIYGPEKWCEFVKTNWLHWDLWFCLVCEIDFGGNWRKLEEIVIDKRRATFLSQGWDAKDSHLHDLESRLTTAGLTAADLVQQFDGDPKYKTVLAKARRKVLKQSIDNSKSTPAMINTPRRRLGIRCNRGRWGRYKVSPQAYCETYAEILDSADSRWGRVMTVEGRIQDDLENATENSAMTTAIWRGFLTAGIEAFENGWRDSDGQLGQLLGDAIVGFSSVPPEHSGATAEDYIADLCELCAWDNWGVTHEQKNRVFRNLRSIEEVDIAENVLLSLESEYRSFHLDYQADEASALVAQLHATANRFERFIEDAERLGCDMWMPIAALGQAAMKTGRVDLAIEVFRVATARKGSHREYLRQVCAVMTSEQKPNTSTQVRHLRLVSD